MQMVVNMCTHGVVPQVLSAMIRAPRVLHRRGWAAGLAFAPTLGDALARFVEQFQISNPYMSVHLKINSVQAVIQVEIDASIPKVTHAYCGMGALFQIYRCMQPYGFDVSPEWVLETAADEEDFRFLQIFLSTELHFGSDGYRIRFPKSWLRHPNPDFEPDLWRRLTNATVGQNGGQDLVAQAVRAEVSSALERSERPPPLEEMARRFGVSERTLVRRLTKAGTGYSCLINEERQALAARLIIDPEVSLQQIADRLAFGDRQGFGRSFRAWFGESPGRYRRRRLSACDVA
jgi:AraC-like DNA-binding protein